MKIYKILFWNLFCFVLGIYNLEEFMRFFKILENILDWNIVGFLGMFIMI